MLLKPDTIVSKTIYFSLVVQIITTLVSFEGLFRKISDKDYVLKEILVLEGLVQLIESFFYIWVIFAIHDLNKVTPRRYIDWTFSTPIMLTSTIVFMKYQEYKEKGINKTFRLLDFFKENKTNIFKIFIYIDLYSSIIIYIIFYSYICY